MQANNVAAAVLDAALSGVLWAARRGSRAITVVAVVALIGHVFGSQAFDAAAPTGLVSANEPAGVAVSEVLHEPGDQAHPEGEEERGAQSSDDSERHGHDGKGACGYLAPSGGGGHCVAVAAVPVSYADLPLKQGVRYGNVSRSTRGKSSSDGVRELQVIRV